MTVRRGKRDPCRTPPESASVGWRTGSNRNRRPRQPYGVAISFRNSDKTATAPFQGETMTTELKPTGRTPVNSDAARDIAYHVHAQTNLDAHVKNGPFIIARGDGAGVIDDQGNRYIDAMAGLWSAALGFSEKRLADAAYRQMLELPYSSTFAGRSCPIVIELAERLVAIAPKGVTRAMFCNSGSEA